MAGREAVWGVNLHLNFNLLHLMQRKQVLEQGGREGGEGEGVSRPVAQQRVGFSTSA